MVGIVACDAPPAGRQLHQREVPENVQPRPLVPIAPINELPLQPFACRFGLAQPCQHVTHRPAGPSQQLGIAAPRGKPIRVLGQLERVRIAPVEAKDRENQERVRAECIVVEPFSQPQRAASMALAPSALRGRADVSGLGSME